MFSMHSAEHYPPDAIYEHRRDGNTKGAREGSATQAVLDHCGLVAEGG